MTAVAVVGGAYFENLLVPELNLFYGSGGRAAAALAGELDVTLHTYSAPDSSNALAALSRQCGFSVSSHPSSDAIRFFYAHGLSAPAVSPSPLAIRQNAPIQVTASSILVFGMMEGAAAVDGDSVVYDPQSEVAPTGFRAFGSVAKRLAIVANKEEVAKLTGVSDVVAGAQALMKQEAAEAVVVKCGAGGVLVGEAAGWSEVPAYYSDFVFPLGSGDVFSAAMTLFWAVRGMAAAKAADLASRCVAAYVNNRKLPLATEVEIAARTFDAVKVDAGTVYLAGPFFTLQERRLVEEALHALGSDRLKVFSPIHEVGHGPSTHVATEDLKGLRASDRVFAILDGCDPGTVFEVGYARALGKPVFAYCDPLPDRHLTMIEGSGCMVLSDLPTAVYRTIWNR
jgi:hypothetical protein